MTVSLGGFPFIPGLYR